MDKRLLIKRCLSTDPIQTILSLNRLIADPWQERALRSEARRLLMITPRQSGKSTVAAIIALAASTIPGGLAVACAPTMRQSGELLRAVRVLHKPLEEIHRIRNESVLRLEFTNGGRVVAIPGTETTVRGLAGAAVVVLDETACLPTADLYFSLSPMVAVSGGRIIILSTPRQPGSWFHKLWTDDNDFDKIHISYEDCPRLNPKFLESERLSMPKAVFDREYRAVFVDQENSDSPFNPDLFRRAIDPMAQALEL